MENRNALATLMRFEPEQPHGENCKDETNCILRMRTAVDDDHASRQPVNQRAVATSARPAGGTLHAHIRRFRCGFEPQGAANRTDHSGYRRSVRDAAIEAWNQSSVRPYTSNTDRLMSSQTAIDIGFLRSQLDLPDFCAFLCDVQRNVTSAGTADFSDCRSRPTCRPDSPDTPNHSGGNFFLTESIRRHDDGQVDAASRSISQTANVGTRRIPTLLQVLLSWSFVDRVSVFHRSTPNVASGCSLRR